VTMLTYKVLAALLVYPEQEVIDSLDEMAAVLDRERALPRADRRAVGELMARLRALDLMEAQADYVGLFDRSPSLSLHLFQHSHGDSRERGEAMARLVDHYRSKGMEVTASELPDFLPLFLEFLSTQPAGEARDLLAQAVDIVALVGERLAQRGSPYQAVFRAIEALAPRRADRRAIREMVATEGRDDTPEALDKSWEDAPVTFRDESGSRGGTSGCSAAAAVVARFAPSNVR
jgi:nitrate reductase molybdenum cofactor assembly chaperone NarJ/NarW